MFIILHMCFFFNPVPMFIGLYGAVEAPVDDKRRLDGKRLSIFLEVIYTALESDLRWIIEDKANPMTTEEIILANSLSVLAYAEFKAGPLKVPEKVSQNITISKSDRLSKMVAAFCEGRFIRVVNYHNTPASASEAVAKELLNFGKQFWPTGVAELEELFAGKWDYPRPPLLPVFYEGYRNNFEIAAPHTETAGLIGWFFIITGFIESNPEDQLSFAKRCDIDLVKEELDRDRLAMTWEEVSKLSIKHVIAAHTYHHASVLEVRNAEEFSKEIYYPATKLRQVIGKNPPAHAFKYGTGLCEWKELDTELHKANFTWCFSNTAIHAIDTVLKQLS